MEVRPGYKKTEVGVFPEEWAIEPLSRHATFRTGPFGSALHKSEYTSDGVPVVNPMHIVDGKIEPTRTMTITEDAARKLSDFRMKAGEIVIGRRGDMGRCAVVQHEHVGWLCGTGSMIIRPQNADPEFLQRVLSSPRAIAAIEDASVGTTMVNLNQGTLARLKIQFPRLPEQYAIAALSDVDALLDGLDRLIAKKLYLKQAAMQQLLTGKTRLPGYEGEWETVRLADVSAFITKGSTPTTYGFGWQLSGVLFLRSECVSPEGLDLAQSMFISAEAHRVLRRSAVRSKDLLITITGNVGRVVRLPGDFGEANINQHIARIRIVDEATHPGWVYHVLSQPGVRQHFEKITTGQAYPQISLAQVRDAVIPRPAIAEQREISAALDDMDGEITVLEARRDKTRDVKQAMMQELLTGKTRLVPAGAVHA